MCREFIWCDMMSFYRLWYVSILFYLSEVLWPFVLFNLTNRVWLFELHDRACNENSDACFFLWVIHFWPLTLCCRSARGHAVRGRWCVTCTVRLRRVAWFLRTSAPRRTSRWPSTPVGRETALHTGWARTGRGWGLILHFTLFIGRSETSSRLID